MSEADIPARFVKSSQKPVTRFDDFSNGLMLDSPAARISLAGLAVY